MKITKVSIKNFRSLEEIIVEGPLNDLWTFVGQNNSGKSAILYSIRAFYGDYDINQEDFNRIHPDAPIEVTIEYLLSDEEFSDLPEYYKLSGNRLIVTKRFTKEDLKGESHGHEKTNDGEEERQDEFFGARNVQIGKLGSVIYIPAIKDLSEELKKTKSSIFSKLIGRIISEAVEGLSSWNGLVEKAQEFSEDLRSPVKDSGEINSVHEIEENLSQMLSSWNLKTQISITPPTPEDIILSGAKLRFLSDKTGYEENPLTLGSGAQRSIVNSLLLLWAQIESKKAKSDKKKFNGNLTLILYEEPEALLHYDQERKLLKNLEDITKSENSQVVISTHSPNLISNKNNALLCITRLMLEGNTTKNFKASQKFVSDIISEENLFDFVLWLNPDRNTMFFVDKVVLVEGPTEKALLNYIIQTEDILSNVYIVDCGGKKHIPRFMNLCEEFGIDHVVMHDKDNNSTENHIKWNADIKSSKNQHTKEIWTFPEALEDYIGFENGGDKAINILKQLKENKLTDQLKQEFITFIKN